jgi:hypothetical protein
MAIVLAKAYKELIVFNYKSGSLGREQLDITEMHVPKSNLVYFILMALVNFAFIFNLIEVFGLLMIETFDIVHSGSKSSIFRYVTMSHQ